MTMLATTIDGMSTAPVVFVVCLIFLVPALTYVIGHLWRSRYETRRVRDQYNDALYMVMKTLHENPTARADTVSEALDWNMIPTAMVEEFDK